MKWFSLVLFLFTACVSYAAQLPDNIYFRAMQDEMTRSKKQLRLPGTAKPFYIAYLVEVIQKQHFSAELGALTSSVDTVETENTPQVQVGVYIYAGDAKQNSSGLEEKDKTFSRTVSLPGYMALREDLWYLTDREYIRAAKRAERKTALKRDKHLTAQESEFSRALHAQFTEELEPFTPRDRAAYNQWATQLSVQGKRYPYIENYGVRLVFGQKQYYFLDSEGNFAQWTIPQNTVTFSAAFRTQDGLAEKIQDYYVLPTDPAQEKDFVDSKSAYFLTSIEKMYHAKKGDFYVGPVLLVNDGASQFLERLLLDNLRNTKPLLMESDLEDPSVGKLVKKVNRRILSTGIDVVDRPSLKTFNGLPLAGFYPVDAEGVAAKDLQVVEDGYLKEIPTVRSLLPGQKQSNGRAHISNGFYPRASLSNMFVTSKQPVTQQQLEEKLLTLCREQKLEYCYIIYSWQGRGGLNIAERIYSADGRREPVYGLVAEQENDTRALRDIVATGEELNVYPAPNFTIVAPNLLVNEVELKPTTRDPDRPHLVPMP